MRLNEIFQEATLSPQGVENLEKVLDKNYYQPTDKVQADRPVLDMEISKSPSSHFIQRFNQRSDIAGFDLTDVAKLLAKAKSDPSMGYASKLDALSRETDPDEEMVLQAKEKNPLTIPVMVIKNPEAVKSQEGKPVALDKSGNKIPKNQIIPKTVMRKGISD